MRAKKCGAWSRLRQSACGIGNDASTVATAADAAASAAAAAGAGVGAGAAVVDAAPAGNSLLRAVSILVWTAAKRFRQPNGNVACC